MKITFFFVLFFSMTGFGQSNNNLKQQLKVSRDSLEVQQQIILDLTEQLESSLSSGHTTAELLQKLRNENEALRRIMRDYINQIDDLNNKNAQLSRDLDNAAKELEKCK